MQQVVYLSIKAARTQLQWGLDKTINVEGKRMKCIFVFFIRGIILLPSYCIGGKTNKEEEQEEEEEGGGGGQEEEEEEQEEEQEQEQEHKDQKQEQSKNNNNKQTNKRKQKKENKEHFVSFHSRTFVQSRSLLQKTHDAEAC